MQCKGVIRYDIMCGISIMALYICQAFGSQFFLRLKLKCPEIPLQPITFASSKYLPLIDGLLN